MEQPVMVRTRLAENREGQPVDDRYQFTAGDFFRDGEVIEHID